MGSLSRILCPLVLTAAFLPGLVRGAEMSDPGQIAMTVARYLEQGHYSRQKLDDGMSQKFLNTYLTTLDYNKLYFTQVDVDSFQKKYGATLGDSVLRGDLGPARDIFAVFKQRVEDRIASDKKLAKKDYKFDGHDTVEINRQDAPWPKDQADADRIWKDRIEAELLKEKMANSESGHVAKDASQPHLPVGKGDTAPPAPVEVKDKTVEVKLRSPQETVTRRYDQMLRNVREMDDEDVVRTFLTSLAQTYDPHSEYLSPSDLENFQISMKLSLVGVGAVLESEDGYAKIKEIVPGGPADKDGHLKVNDRIAEVAQGDGEFEDVVDMKLDKVVEKIRGKKGSTVKLMVIPGDATDPAKRKIVQIVRDEVKLKDSEAKADVIDVPGPNGRTTRIGWVTLPSFYANMDDSGAPKSTTEDVAALIGRLKQEGIQGLVMDLRRDGGGSLEEAINLTGLFIPKGPVVQAKDSSGKITVSQDTDPGVAYSGPMMVLVNRLSASASEIFAAALQDYNRALIVGDERTFGKGTVQTVLKLGQAMPFFSLLSPDPDSDQAGALKLTIQKFYRVKGGSTQLKGVESNIVLPSTTDNSEIGEGSLKNRMNYDEVASLPITDTQSITPLLVEELKAQSAERIAHDPEFTYIKQDMADLKEKLAKNTISLNEKERRAELAADKLRTEKRDAERLARGPALDAKDYEVTLEELTVPKLRAVAYNKEKDKSLLSDDDDDDDSGDAKQPAKPRPDPIRDEALRIMADFVSIDKQAKTASVQPVKVP